MERLPTTLVPMSAWSEQLVSRFAASLRSHRVRLGLSAQDVADRTEQLGHPVSRTAIADFELGRRKDRLMLGDAVALADALRMPLAMLLYPEMPDGEVQALPGVTTSSLKAAQSLVGINGSFIEDAPEGVDNDQRRRDYRQSQGLYDMGIQVQRMRDEVENIHLAMQRPEVRDDFELVTKALEKIDGIEKAISEKAEIIRLMGGVVHDG